VVVIVRVDALVFVTVVLAHVIPLAKDVLDVLALVSVIV